MTATAGTAEADVAHYAGAYAGTLQQDQTVTHLIRMLMDEHCAQMRLSGSTAATSNAWRRREGHKRSIMVHLLARNERRVAGALTDWASLMDRLAENPDRPELWKRLRDVRGELGGWV